MHVRTLFKAVGKCGFKSQLLEHSIFHINCDTIKVSIKKKKAYLLHQNGSLNIGVNYKMLIEKIGFQGL